MKKFNSEERIKAYLLLFSASWCGPSKRFVEQIEAGGINCYTYVDIDENTDLTMKYSIAVIPTSILIDMEGNIIKKWVGEDDEDPGQSKFVSYIKNCGYDIIKYPGVIKAVTDEHLDEVDEDIDEYDDETESNLDNFYNIQHKMNREAKAKNNPEAQRILQLVEVVNKVQSQFWDACIRSGNPEKRFQFHSMFDLIKNALYYSWEKLGFGHHSDFWEEGDSMFDYMMFETGPEERINAIVHQLETSSPFAMVEIDSAITNGLLSVFKKVLRV